MDISSDCTIMGGDSGGPVFDMEGRVIGISSTCGNSVVENRHIAVDRFQRYWDRLLKGEDMDELEPARERSWASNPIRMPTRPASLSSRPTVPPPKPASKTATW